MTVSFDIPAAHAKQLLGTMSTLVEEATFSATKDGMEFRGMDPSHVGLIDIKLNPDNYECGDDVRFAFRVDELAKITKRAGKDDTVHVAIGDAMDVSLGARRKYSLRLIDAEPKDAPLPKLAHDIRFTISTADLISAISDIAVMSNFVTLKSKSNRITAYGKGDTGSASSIMEIQELGQCSDGEGTYSLEYLTPFLKNVTAGSVTVEYSDVKPICVSADGISFYLAPRVEQ